jgi:soluble lytic murein transglycosylase-like protein
MMDKIAMVESSDRHMTDGKLTESPVGALGKYQIMPATAAKPGYGVKPIPDLRKASEAEHKAFAESYYQAMLKEFDGDEEKALAAYNGGVGRVKRAVAKDPNNWVALVPKESREYITKVQTA